LTSNKLHGHGLLVGVGAQRTAAGPRWVSMARKRRVAGGFANRALFSLGKFLGLTTVVYFCLYLIIIV